MLYNYVLFFLGFYSWDYKSSSFIEKLLKKKELNHELLLPIKKEKKLLQFTGYDSNSPSLNSYINIINLKENTSKDKFILFIYNFYSLCIFILLCIQPSYLIYKLNNDDKVEENIIMFLININTPITYLWSKYYFRTNHFELYNNVCKNNCGSYIFIILFFVFISIIINLLHVNSFYNEFYYVFYFGQNIGLTIVIIEWIYARITFALTSSAFTIVFCKHVKEIKNFIDQIILNEFHMEDTHCLGNLIRSISNLRHSVEISINFFNKLLSIITVTGGISVALFIRHKYLVNIEYINNINNSTFKNSYKYILFEDKDYYLIQTFIFYFFCQFIFFWNVLYYSVLRNRLLTLIQSPSFINKFLTRWSTTKIKKKCKDTDEIKHLSKIILCIEEENATTIDWLVLDKLVKNKWMDFSILGISSQDGSLIKKVITFSSLIYFVLSYF